MSWCRPSLLVVLLINAGCHRGPESGPSRSRDRPQHQLEVVVESSGSEEVDALVKKLVSTRPAPYPEGYWPVPYEFVVKYATPEVTSAMATLKKRGPYIFPYLVHHLNDDRYCYSSTVQAVDNYTVGQAIRDLLCDDEPWGPVYMDGRNSLQGPCSFLTFDQYLKDKNVSEWARWATNKTRLEIQLNFIDWCVATEEQRGFVDVDQRAKLLYRYDEVRERMKRKYSESDDGTNRSQPIRADTNQTLPAAGVSR